LERLFCARRRAPAFDGTRVAAEGDAAPPDAEAPAEAAAAVGASLVSVWRHEWLLGPACCCPRGVITMMPPVTGSQRRTELSRPRGVPGASIVTSTSESSAPKSLHE